MSPLTCFAVVVVVVSLERKKFNLWKIKYLSQSQIEGDRTKIQSQMTS